VFAVAPVMMLMAPADASAVRWSVAEDGAGDAAVAADRSDDPGAAPAAEDTALTFERTPPQTVVTASVGSFYNFEAEFDDSGGEASVFYAGGGVDVSRRVTERLRLSFGVDYFAAQWDFDGLDDGFLPNLERGAEPFDTLHSIGVSVGGGYQIDERWLAFGNVGVNASFEGGAKLSDALTVGGALGVGYRVNDDLRLGFGVLGSTRLEDSARIVPTIGVNWRITEKWTLGSTGALARAADRNPLNQGIAVELSYQATAESRLFTRLAANSDRYRLSEDNDAAEDGIFEHERVSLGVGVDWQPGPATTVRLTGGLLVYSNIEFEDEDGREISDAEGDLRPFIGVVGVIRF
jgi:hypothetical protein